MFIIILPLAFSLIDPSRLRHEALIEVSSYSIPFIAPFPVLASSLAFFCASSEVSKCFGKQRAMGPVWGLLAYSQTYGHNYFSYRNSKPVTKQKNEPNNNRDRKIYINPSRKLNGKDAIKQARKQTTKNIGQFFICVEI